MPLPEIKPARYLAGVSLFNDTYIYCFDGCVAKIDPTAIFCRLKIGDKQWEKLEVDFKWKNRTQCHAIQCGKKEIVVFGGVNQGSTTSYFKESNILMVERGNESDVHIMSKASDLFGNSSFYSTIAPVICDNFAVAVDHDRNIHTFSFSDKKWDFRKASSYSS